MTLQSIYEQQQNTAVQLTTTFDSRLDRVLSDIVTIAQVKLNGLTQDDIIQYEYIWQQVLEESGYYQLVTEYVDQSFDDIYDDVLKGFEAGGITTAFTQSDLQNIQVLKNMHKQFFVKLGDDIGLTVKKNLYNYALSNASMEQMAINIRNDIQDSGLAKYSKTYARTAITEYQQEVINSRSQDIDGVWIYEGVVDDATRPFCRRLMGDNNYYTDSQKSRLEGDPDREFNCRHRFYLVSKEWAENAGYQKA